jgi:plasmid stabilization system protein ParE
MERSLIVTSKARRNLKYISSYISKKFGRKSADEYLNNVNTQVQIIFNNPQRYPKETIKDINVSVCVFKKKTIIQFVYTEKEVVILSILDARSNWK